MKTRLLFLSLLCLIGFGLNAQSGLSGLMKHRRTHQNDKKTLSGARAALDFYRQDMKSVGGVPINKVIGKYYPPKMNREFVSYNEDGTTTFQYRKYYELDSWGNVLLEEEGTNFRIQRTYSDETQGKLQLSESEFRWNDSTWVDDLPEMHFTTQLNDKGIRTGVTGRRVKEASFNEKGYLTWLYEAYQEDSQARDRAKVKVSWKNDFPSSLTLVSYGDSIVLKDVVPMYEADKFNPYLCFSDDWEEFFFDSDGDDFVLFNATMYWSSDEDETGILSAAEGRVVSAYDAEKKTYTRTIYLTMEGMEIPFIVETKTYLDNNGSFVYTYAGTFDNWTSSVTKLFNEHGDLVKEESKDVEEGSTYSRIETYERLYDDKGYPVKVIFRSGSAGYIETYGEKILPDTSLEVTVVKEGTLRDAILSVSGEYHLLKELKVSGPLNDRDLMFIRSDLYQLQVLDLGSAKLTYIPDGQFENSRLVTVILPDGLKYIGSRAFSYCSQLRAVDLPASLNYLGEGVFNKCVYLERIVCRMIAPLDITEDPFFGVDMAKCRLEVPVLSVDSYKKNQYWQQFSILEGSKDIAVSESAILNGNLLLNEIGFSAFTNLTLGYGANLIVEGEVNFPLKSFVMYQGDNQMWEKLAADSWKGSLSGRRATSSSLINKCDMTSDEVRIEYVCREGCWYFLSFPFDVDRNNLKVEKVDTTDLSKPEFVFRYYDGARRALDGVGQSWKNVTDNILKAGCGYIFQASTEVRLIVKGYSNVASQMLSPDSRNIVVSENLSKTPSNQGWNLVGNPYPSHYNIQGMDFKVPITVWNPDKYTYEAYSVLDADQYVLSPVQAFFVQVPTGTTSIRFAPEMRCSGESDLNKPYTRSMGSERSLINLRLSDGVHADKTRIAVAPGASMGYDMQEDAAKFMSPVASVPQLYTFDKTRVQYAINAQPLSDGENVQIGYYAGKAGEYTLFADRADMDVWLYDALTGVTEKLTAEGYHFTTEQGSFDNRFRLYIGISPTSVNDPDSTACEILSVKGGLLIKGQINQSIEVYTIAGMKIAEITPEENGTTISLTQGVYIIKVGDSIYKSVVY